MIRKSYLAILSYALLMCADSVVADSLAIDFRNLLSIDSKEHVNFVNITVQAAVKGTGKISFLGCERKKEAGEQLNVFRCNTMLDNKPSGTNLELKLKNPIFKLPLFPLASGNPGRTVKVMFIANGGAGGSEGERTMQPIEMEYNVPNSATVVFPTIFTAPLAESKTEDGAVKKVGSAAAGIRK